MTACFSPTAGRGNCGTGRPVGTEFYRAQIRCQRSYRYRSIRVGWKPSLCQTIKRFSVKYPLIQFHLYNEMADNIRDRLEKGLVDVGLLLEPVDTSRYDFVRLSQKETWGILMRDDHPLAERKTITPDEIAEYPLILPLRERVRNEILNWWRKEEKDLTIPLSYTLLSNAALMVEAGLGAAFAWMERWPFTAVRILALSRSLRNTRPAVCLSGRRIRCFLRRQLCLYRKLICFARM